MKRVAIIGAGALGSHVAMFLRNAAELRIVDFDKVESKNTLSQFHGRHGLGKNKTKALQQVINMMWSKKVEVTPHKLVPENAEVVLSGCDLVLDCLDNIESRQLVSATCRTLGLPLLHGALDDAGQFGAVVWDADFKPDAETELGQATCEDGAQLPFIGIVAAHLARAAQEFLTTGRQLGFHITPGGTTRI